MYGRFVILTDEHVPYALVEALRKAGWLIYRVEDEPGLGKSTLDDTVFVYAAERDWVWLSRDEAAVAHPAAWQREGRPFKGMLVWSQRYHRVMSIGEVVRQGRGAGAGGRSLRRRRPLPQALSAVLAPQGPTGRQSAGIQPCLSRPIAGSVTSSERRSRADRAARASHVGSSFRPRKAYK